MKVAALTIIGQHPKGIDLHIRNLQWAIGRNFTHYIITFKKYGFKSLYPNIEFIEIDQDPTQYYEFWSKIAVDVITSMTEDVLILSEQDVLYTNNLIPYIFHTKEKHIIIINDDNYGHSIHDNDEEVFPRLWEGGMMLPVSLVQAAIRDGVSLSAHIQSQKIKEQAAKCHDNLSYEHNKSKLQINQIIHNDTLMYYETLFEFTLYCFFNGYKVSKQPLAVHIPCPETAHRVEPAVYGPIDKDILARVMKGSNLDIFHMPGTIIMLYLSGACPMNNYTNKILINASNVTKEAMHRLKATASLWMNQAELQKLDEFDLIFKRQMKMI